MSTHHQHLAALRDQLHQELDGWMAAYERQLEEAISRGWDIHPQITVTIPEEEVARMAAEGRAEALNQLRNHLSPQARLDLAAAEARGDV